MRSEACSPAPRWLPIGLALLLLATVSCGVIRRPKTLFGGRLVVQVEISPTANRNSPIAVELLLIRDRGVLERLKTMSAGEWFENRKQFYRDAPQGFQSCSWQGGACMWEWVPGQEVPAISLEYKAGVRWGLLFADYVTPGSDHRMLLPSPRRHFRLVLGEEDFSVEPLAK